MPVTMAGALSNLALQQQQLGLAAELLAAFAGDMRTTKFLTLWASRMCFGEANALILLPLTKSSSVTAAQTQPLSAARRQSSFFVWPANAVAAPHRLWSTGSQEPFKLPQLQFHTYSYRCEDST